MTATEFVIRPLTLADLPAADAIRQAEGWNQTLADWNRLIAHAADGCFVATDRGRVVGAVSTTSHGNQLAWIGMMLVHAEFRRRGIGRQLMNVALEYLAERGITCVKLDATPAGRPVYSKLGFREEAKLQRWFRDQPPLSLPSSTGAASSVRWEQISPLDRMAFGADRTSWCAALCRDSSVVSVSSGNRVQGIGMLRAGSRVPYLGPIVAESASVGCSIAAQLVTASGGVFWDIHSSNHAAVESARTLGFEPVRDLYRMWRGSPVAEDPLLQFAITAPETG